MNDETALTDSEARHGQDWGNYCSLDEIRAEAGFTSAFNLNDSLIFRHRRSAQSKINTALGSVYTVPFKPVPEIIRTLTIKLAAGMLLQSAYGERSWQCQSYAERSTRVNSRLTEPSRQPASKRTIPRLN